MPSACIECRFFHSLETPSEQKANLFGQCRRNPPLPLAPDGSNPAFPVTYSDLWCGEFVARLASEPLSVEPNPLSSEPAEGEPTP